MSRTYYTIPRIIDAYHFIAKNDWSRRVSCMTEEEIETKAVWIHHGHHFDKVIEDYFQFEEEYLEYCRERDEQCFNELTDEDFLQMESYCIKRDDIKEPMSIDTGVPWYVDEISTLDNPETPTNN